MRERKIGGLGGLDMACRWTFSIVIKQLNSKMDPENLSDFFFKFMVASKINLLLFS